ncbi:Dopey-like protein, partial [Hamiltosporidium magnivora]
NTDIRYNTEIKKKLDAFKTAKQWSDFISLLSSLDTTLKKHNTTYIPHKTQLFKRLSQCLNPALPSGVHNKVLQTYHIIFQKLDTQNFIKNFNLYTLGLFSFSIHTRLILKSQYVTLIHTHIIPLSPYLHPFISNILLGILPNLDEENTDHYSQALKCLKDLLTLIPLPLFNTSLFYLLQTCTHLRQPITNYLIKYSIQYKVYITLQTIKAFSYSLKDKEIFVLRSILDILIMKYNLKKILEYSGEGSGGVGGEGGDVGNGGSDKSKDTNGDNIDIRDNIDNKDKASINRDNIDNTNNIDNRDNIDNKDNIDIRDNIDNTPIIDKDIKDIINTDVKD